MRNTKNQRGFTLVELIVVIAILGVLAAIAVPTVNNYLGSSKERSFNAELDRIQTAVDASLSAPDNTRFEGKRQYPIIGRGQTGQSHMVATTTANLADDQDPFPGDSSEYWNPLGGRAGADLKTAWSDGDTDGVRDTGSGSPDTWTTVSVTKGGQTYYVDPRYYFIDFESLTDGGYLEAIPKSAGVDNKPEGSTKTYSGSYIWYIDDKGKVQALYGFLPTTQGHESGVFP